MWKTLDLLKRNVTRPLPPRCDTGVRESSGGGAPGVGSSSVKIASKTSADWVPESIMRIQNRLKRKSQHNRQKVSPPEILKRNATLIGRRLQ